MATIAPVTASATLAEPLPEIIESDLSGSDTESDAEEEEDEMEVETTHSETSSTTKSAGEEVSKIWEDSKTYEAGSRIAFKKRVYEAKRRTSGHPTSRLDWKVLPREIAFIKKVKLTKTKPSKTDITKSNK